MGSSADRALRNPGCPIETIREVAADWRGELGFPADAENSCGNGHVTHEQEQGEPVSEKETRGMVTGSSTAEDEEALSVEDVQSMVGVAEQFRRARRYSQWDDRLNRSVNLSVHRKNIGTVG